MTSLGLETDELLAVAGAAGEREAFARLVRRHGSGVQALLERMVGDHHRALDLSQEVWMKVHRALPSFDARRRFRPWLLRIAVNHGRDALRKHGRRLAETPVEAEELVGEPDTSARLFERAEIERALALVDEPYRTALVLVDVLGQTYQEASDSLGCALGTIKSRVGRGREAFRRHYRREEVEGANTAARDELAPRERRRARSRVGDSSAPRARTSQSGIGGAGAVKLLAERARRAPARSLLDRLSASGERDGLSLPGSCES